MKPINIQLNGEQCSLPKELTIEQAIALWDSHAYQTNTVNTINNIFAIAVNEQFIPNSNYGTTIIKAGDRVERLYPMQGG